MTERQEQVVALVERDLAAGRSPADLWPHAARHLGERWAAERLGPRPPTRAPAPAQAARGVQPPSAPAKGPGPALHRLLAENGLAAEGCAECADWSAKMNRWTVEGCRGEHREEILNRLRAAAAKRGWLKNGWTGLKLARQSWFSLAAPFESILQEALRRAESAV
jgi:hypothetical protein